MASVADADLIDRRRPARSVVDLEVDDEGLDVPKRAQQADDIGKHAPSLLQLGRLRLCQLRGHAHARDIQIGPSVGEAKIDPVLLAGERRLDCLKRIGRNPQRQGEVVSRAEGKHCDRLVQPQKIGKRIGQSSVAAADGDALRALAMGGQQALDVVFVLGDGQQRIASRRAPLGKLRQRLGRPRGLRVYDHEQAQSIFAHAATLRRANAKTKRAVASTTS